MPLSAIVDSSTYTQPFEDGTCENDLGAFAVLFSPVFSLFCCWWQAIVYGERLWRHTAHLHLKVEPALGATREGGRYDSKAGGLGFLSLLCH